MPEVARCHIQEIERHHRVGFRNMLQTAAFHQPYRRVDDRFRGKSVGCTVLQPKNVAGQVESTNLAAAVGEKLVGANSAVRDLVDIVGRLRLSKDFRPLVVFEFARDYPCARKLTELPECRRPASGMGIDVDKHGSLPV
jgi:hypothetical protein